MFQTILCLVIDNILGLPRAKHCRAADDRDRRLWLAWTFGGRRCISVWPGPFSFDLLVFVHARCCGGFRLSSGSPLEQQYQLLVKSDQASSGWVSAYRTLAVCTRFRFFSHDAGAHIHDRDDDFGSVRCGYRWWLVCSAVLSRDRARSILMQMSH